MEREGSEGAKRDPKMLSEDSNILTLQSAASLG